MLVNRHDAIGIKQVIRFEWMQKTVRLLLSGLDKKTIRQELHEYIHERKSHGSKGRQSGLTRSFAVNNLMKIWASPDPELTLFRNDSLSLAEDNLATALAVNWGMISAVYPFWFNTARVTGRLLTLQDQVTQMQIINRLKEEYGDRETVSRYGRFVIRSFVAWGVLKDADVRGCYKKNSQVRITEIKPALLLFESALLASPDAKSELGLLLNNPAFFPFHFPVMNGDLISQNSDRIEMLRYGLDDVILLLKTKK